MSSVSQFSAMLFEEKFKRNELLDPKSGMLQFFEAQLEKVDAFDYKNLINHVIKPMDYIARFRTGKQFSDDWNQESLVDDFGRRQIDVLIDVKKHIDRVVSASMPNFTTHQQEIVSMLNTTINDKIELQQERANVIQQRYSNFEQTVENDLEAQKYSLSTTY